MSQDILIGENYQILPFSDLPLSHKLAIAWYMSIDGDAWECPGVEDMSEDETVFKAEFEAAMPHFDKRYGKELFGITVITAQQAKDAFMGDKDIGEDFKSWDDYHAWYTSGEMPTHSADSRWPVILNDTKDEPFLDGNHRLHSYLRDGHSEIPAVFYPDSKHLHKLVITAQISGQFD